MTQTISHLINSVFSVLNISYKKKFHITIKLIDKTKKLLNKLLMIIIMSN